MEKPPHLDNTNTEDDDDSDAKMLDLTNSKNSSELTKQKRNPPRN